MPCSSGLHEQWACTWAFLSRPPVLPPKMGEGVLGSRVGGFHAAFSFFSSALTAMLRARRGAVTLLRSAVPWKLLCRLGAEHVGAAFSITDAIAAADERELCRSDR